MRKVLTLMIVIVAMAGILYYYITSLNEQAEEASSIYLTDKRVIELSKNEAEVEAFVLTIKENPSQVLKMNNLIRKMVYSGEYSDEEVENLVKLQRRLFHEELLKINPEQAHQLLVRNELNQWSKAGYKLIGSDYLPPEYIGDKNQNASFKVVFYTNDPSRDIYVRYALVKNDDELWEIIGWVPIEPFEIVK